MNEFNKPWWMVLGVNSTSELCTESGFNQQETGTIVRQLHDWLNSDEYREAMIQFSKDYISEKIGKS